VPVGESRNNERERERERGREREREREREKERLAKRRRGRKMCGGRERAAQSQEKLWKTGQRQLPRHFQALS
jgi:hypothetical protein